MMNKEIGGYLEYEHYSGKEYHNDCLALSTGRNCLKFLLRERKIKKIAIPKLHCGSISDVCMNEGVKVEYYDVDNEWKPILEEYGDYDGYIYIINYYGQLSNNYIIQLKKKLENIILDNTQAFFQYPLNGVDTIYSCRKYFGVTDGAYLYTDCFTEESVKCLKYDCSYDRINYLAGRMEVDADAFYLEFKKREEMTAEIGLSKMSKFTRNILKSLDYEKIGSIRFDNFHVLAKALNGINLLTVKEVKGPFMYPLLLNNGAKLRQKLIEKKIFIPILWPSVFQQFKEDKNVQFYADNILPLPCDQRYSSDDMRYIVDDIYNICAKIRT